MRKALFVLAAMVLFAAPAGANLLVNGGFETGDLTGWTPFQFGGSPVRSVVSSPVFEGDYALWIQCDGGSEGGVYQRFATVPGNQYQVSFYYRHAEFWQFFGLDPNGGTNPNSGSIGWDDLAGTGGEWKLHTKTFVANSTMATIYLDNWGRPDGYWDSVVAIPEPGSLAALAGGLIGFIGLGIRRRR